MYIRASLVNYSGEKIKKFTATLINENGNTLDRVHTRNGNVKLSVYGSPSTFGFKNMDSGIGNYTVEFILLLDNDTTLIKRELVTITSSDLDNGYKDIVSTIGDCI